MRGLRTDWRQAYAILNYFYTIDDLLHCNRTDFFVKKNYHFFLEHIIDTEYRDADPTGMGVIVQNSLRKRGKYTNPLGKDFFSAIYWYRIINETSAPLELTIDFPAGSFATLPSPDPYLKVFQLLYTMTMEKEGLYAYGATGLESFLNAGLNEPTRLQRTIAPKGACLFYIGALYYPALAPSKAELVIKDRMYFTGWAK